MADVEILVTIPETCRALKLSRTKVYELLSNGSLSSTVHRAISADPARRGS